MEIMFSNNIIPGHTTATVILHFFFKIFDLLVSNMKKSLCNVQPMKLHSYPFLSLRVQYYLDPEVIFLRDSSHTHDIMYKCSMFIISVSLNLVVL